MQEKKATRRVANPDSLGVAPESVLDPLSHSPVTQEREDRPARQKPMMKETLGEQRKQKARESVRKDAGKF